MNRVFLMGRLVRDPELRYTQSGTGVTSFTIAVDREFGKEKETDFINCVAWQKSGEHIAQYYKKGQRILLEGRIQVRSYDDNDGKKRWVTEVIVSRSEFCESKKEGSAKESDYLEGEELTFDDNDLPF